MAKKKTIKTPPNYDESPKKLTARFDNTDVRRLAALREKFKLGTDNAALKFAVCGYANLHEQHEAAKEEIRQLREFRENMLSLQTTRDEAILEIKQKISEAQEIKQSVRIKQSWEY